MRIEDSLSERMIRSRGENPKRSKKGPADELGWRRDFERERIGLQIHVYVYIYIFLFLKVKRLTGHLGRVLLTRSVL